VLEHSRAVALDVLVEPDAGASLGKHGCERGLADFERIAPQVVASSPSAAGRLTSAARLDLRLACPAAE
jgi:hypothetical protein